MRAAAFLLVFLLVPPAPQDGPSTPQESGDSSEGGNSRKVRRRRLEKLRESWPRDRFALVDDLEVIVEGLPYERISIGLQGGRGSDMYAMTLESSGAASLHVSSGCVMAPGDYTGTVHVRTYSRLCDLVLAADVFSLDDRYSSPLVHATEWRVSVTAGRAEKTVVDRMRSAPEPLQALEDALDIVCGEIEWSPRK